MRSLFSIALAGMVVSTVMGAVRGAEPDPPGDHIFREEDPRPCW